MIPRFLRPEGWPFTALELVALAGPTTAPLRVVCAWCPGFVPGQQPADRTTGICQSCSDKMIFAAVKRAELMPDALVALEPLNIDIDDDQAGSTCSRACGFCGRCS
jgi:hypothetical protein